MPEVDILDFEVGLAIAVRAGYKSEYGHIVAVAARTVDVETNGVRRRFSRETRRVRGWPGTKYDCPYLASVATAQKKDAEYKAAYERALRNLAAAGTI